MQDKTPKDIVAQAVEYIESHLHDDITLDDISTHTGYSKFHLNRVFTEEVGSPLPRYMQARRLTSAGEQLVETERPIIDIAHETGYGSQQAFTYAFRQRYGCAPLAYRRRGKHTPLHQRHGVPQMRMAA